MSSETKETSALPPFGSPKRFISTHDSSGKAVFNKSLPETLQRYEIPGMHYYEAYTTFEAPIKLQDEADIKAVHANTPNESTISFPKPGSTILRYCDWPPGGAAPLHRHETIDFGIVIFGSIEAFIDSGERRVLGPGDLMVQRNTMHGWRNASTTEWVRVVYVIQGAEPVTVGDKTMGQDLGAFA